MTTLKQQQQKHTQYCEIAEEMGHIILEINTVLLISCYKSSFVFRKDNTYPADNSFALLPCRILKCCWVVGERDHPWYQTTGPRQTPSDSLHHNSQPSAHACRRCGFSHVSWERVVCVCIYIYILYVCVCVCVCMCICMCMWMYWCIECVCVFVCVAT